MFGYGVSVSFRTAFAANTFLPGKFHIDQFHTAAQPSNPFQVIGLFEDFPVYFQTGGNNQSVHFRNPDEEFLVGHLGQIDDFIALLLQSLLKIIVCFGGD